MTPEENLKKTLLCLNNLFKIYMVETDEDGEPLAGVIEIFEAWKEASKILNELYFNGENF